MDSEELIRTFGGIYREASLIRPVTGITVFSVKGALDIVAVRRLGTNLIRAILLDNVHDLEPMGALDPPLPKLSSLRRYGFRTAMGGFLEFRRNGIKFVLKLKGFKIEQRPTENTDFERALLIVAWEIEES